MPRAPEPEPPEDPSPVARSMGRLRQHEMLLASRADGKPDPWDLDASCMRPHVPKLPSVDAVRNREAAVEKKLLTPRYRQTDFVPRTSARSDRFKQQIHDAIETARAWQPHDAFREKIQKEHTDRAARVAAIDAQKKQRKLLLAVEYDDTTAQAGSDAALREDHAALDRHRTKRAHRVERQATTREPKQPHGGGGTESQPWDTALAPSDRIGVATRHTHNDTSVMITSVL